ncbi:MAG TPA: S9 family peptidase, partial [Bacteroidetes bacterium]|nr:S9 family peptidase [Bacteroidota bacterium]
MRTIYILLPAMLLTTTIFSQEKIGYQMPPQPLADLIDAAPTPSVSVSPDDHWLLLLERPGLPSIEEVAQEELRLAGLRINPATNGQSRTSHYIHIRIKSMDNLQERPIAGLPDNARISSVAWSPDSRHFAFLNTAGNGIELWVADAATATAKRMTGAVVNQAMRTRPYSWFSDGQHIIYRHIDPRRGSRPQKPSIPTGPVVQTSEGMAAPVRTYQDMLRNPFDEKLFAYYTTSQLMVLNLQTGVSRPFGEKGIFRTVSPSPDGSYVLLTKIKQPFSYIVPYYRFASETTIYNRNGEPVRQIADLPAAENLPKGFNAVPTGPRSFTWRADRPASLYWVEARDGGDPKKKADVRDQMFFLNAPFKGQPKEALTFGLRYGGVTWGTGTQAIAYEWWRADRREVTRLWQPDNLFVQPQTLFDRSYE